MKSIFFHAFGYVGSGLQGDGGGREEGGGTLESLGRGIGKGGEDIIGDSKGGRERLMPRVACQHACL